MAEHPQDWHPQDWPNDEACALLKNHDKRIERLELEQDSLKGLLAELREDLQRMRESITKQLNSTMLMILASVVLYIVAQLFGLSHG